MSKLNQQTIVLLCILAFLALPAGEFAVVAKASDRFGQKEVSQGSLVNISGRVLFERETEHGGIVVELWRGNSPLDSIDYVSTGDDGDFEFSDVDPNYSYRVYAAAPVSGYASDSFLVESSELLSSGGYFTVPLLKLMLPKKYAIDWVYETEGSNSFTGYNLQTGTVTLTSPTMRWLNSGQISVSAGSSSICFAFPESGCGDVSMMHTFHSPDTIYGYIHDLGEIDFAALNSIPEGSVDNIGPGKYYEVDGVPAVAGHTYAVVSFPPYHYAKIRITEIAYRDPLQVFLPMVIH